ncbi:hypothetical protein B484DRAFT_36811 [Ochromonadaceae sp. CCMP2298]|nr:hypothetical protein B484DRAFT_36811 [Ochromonadaceae sp. CCMP2298]|mmetsp:Transcript_5630/g.12252  ORF Transcript_5630/g.12252 Transcript_5630/m.12252 type:complete len:964 (+) Transcript_5630:67-2958(+)
MQQSTRSFMKKPSYRDDDRGWNKNEEQVVDTRNSSSSGATTPRMGMSKERKQHILSLLWTAITNSAQDQRDLIRKNAVYCRLCIMDAFQGRLSNGLANNSKKSWWIYTIFSIQTSDWLFNAVVWACVFHTLSVFSEPTNQCSASTIYFLVQVVILVIYTFDISLKMGYEGLKEYWKHDWQQLYLIVVLLMWLDLLVNRCTFYTNPLRPVVAILRARKGRRFFEVLKKMIPGMSHSLMPLLFFIVLVMVASFVMYDNTIQELANPAFTSYNWFFLVFTNDNFDRILPNNVVSNIQYLLFFFPCIYVGQQFLLSLIIGDTYETYKSFVKKQLKKEKLKEMQGLTKAFTVLDPEKTGTIGPYKWKECLKQYKPDLSTEAVALYFELISGGNPNISILQFLSLRGVLDFHLNYISDKPNVLMTMFTPVQKYAASVYRSLQIPLFSYFSSYASSALKLTAKSHLVRNINYIDLIALCCGITSHKIYLDPRVYLESFLGGMDAFAVDKADVSVVSIGFLLNCCFVIELLVRLTSHAGKVHLVHKDNNNSSWLFVLGAVCCLSCSLTKIMLPHWHGNTLLFALYYTGSTVPFRKVMLVSQALRCLRILNLNKDLRTFSMALIDVCPALIETFTFNFIITYMFGTGGNLLFGQYMSEWKTPLISVVKAQQLTFMVDFLGATEAAIEAVHPTAALFFVFYLILSLAVSNIALSIIIELQNSMLAGQTIKDRDAQKEKIGTMFEKMKDQARARAILEGKTMLFTHVEMSHFQNSDTRHFIADMDDEKDSKYQEIKQCQKYANIDLIAHYNQEYRNTQDQNWEIDFLAKAKDNGLEQTIFEEGVTIFDEGCAAKTLYLVAQGCVRIGDNYARPIIPAGTFIGVEALHPSSTYGYSCTADQDCKLLVINQDDISDHLDSDVVGTLTRMCFKSFKRIEALRSDAKKKSRSASMLEVGSNEQGICLQTERTPSPFGI